MKRVLIGSFIVLIFAASAHATCYQCRDYSCFMAEGTKAWCEPVGGSGCMTGGTCSGGADCGAEVCEPDQQVAQNKVPPLADEWQLASVVVHRPAKAANAQIAGAWPERATATVEQR